MSPFHPLASTSKSSLTRFFPLPVGAAPASPSGTSAPSSLLACPSLPSSSSSASSSPARTSFQVGQDSGSYLNLRRKNRLTPSTSRSKKLVLRFAHFREQKRLQLGIDMSRADHLREINDGRLAGLLVNQNVELVVVSVDQSAVSESKKQSHERGVKL